MYNTSPIQYWRLNNLDGLHELSSNSHQLKISCPLIINKAWNKAKAQTLGPLPYNTQWCGFNGRFPFNPKFRKFRTMHQTERTISVIFGTRFDRSGYLGRLDRNVPFHLTNCCPQYRCFVFCNQTRGALGRVFATGRDCSIGHVEFPKFHTGIFIEWKAPNIFHI